MNIKSWVSKKQKERKKERKSSSIFYSLRIKAQR